MQGRTGAGIALAAAALAAGTAAGGTGAGADDGARPAAAARPNVVVLMTDDQTAESMRVLPRVRGLIGAAGVTFTDSFASYPLCCPSRSTFLTGQYAHNHGVRGNRPPYGGYGGLTATDRTVPVALRRAGYRTIHIGKYLNGYGRDVPATVPPGWTDWRGSIDPSTYRYWGYTLNLNGTRRTFGNADADYQTDVYARMATEVIRREARARGPFYLSVAFLAPHSGAGRAGAGSNGQAEEDAPANTGRPVNRQRRRAAGLGLPVPAPRHAGAFARSPLPRPPSFDEADLSDKPAAFRAQPRFTPAVTRRIARSWRARRATLLAVDDAVARIHAALRATGQLRDTVILFTSDNGFFHGEHRRPNGKVLVYEPSVRVPLLLAGPGIPRGARRRALVSNVDVPATILDLAGARPLRRLDGRSLLPVARRPRLRTGRDLLLETGAGAARANYEAIRTPRFKYVEYATGERELYDLARDPFELRSRHRDRSYGRIRRELRRRLLVLRSCAGRSCLTRPRGGTRLPGDA